MITCFLYCIYFISTYKMNLSNLQKDEKRGRAELEIILIGSTRSRYPQHFSDFLKNGENERHDINLMEECIKVNRLEVLNALQYSEM